MVNCPLHVTEACEDLLPCFQMWLISLVTGDLLLRDPPQGGAKLMVHGVEKQPVAKVLVELRFISSFLD